MRKWSKWYLVKTASNGTVIRRYAREAGKTVWERYPKEKYRGLREADVEALVRRLNVTWELQRQKALERFNFDHAYLNPKLVEGFEERLRQNASDEGHITSLMNYLSRYVAGYFVLLKHSPDPKLWMEHEAAWGEWLIKQRLAANTIVQIVQTANRYLEHLHRTYPAEIPRLWIEPIGGRKMKRLRALEAEDARVMLISDETYELVLSKTPQIILPCVKLSRGFGLRKAETLGCQEQSLYRSHLHVTRQAVRSGKFGLLKGVESRKVPYWYMTPKEAYEQIKQLPVLHPDTVGDIFADAMAKAGLDVQFHDLRRTWITRALRDHHWRDVQMAAGHKEVQTTMGYAQDDRDMNEELWVPEMVTPP